MPVFPLGAHPDDHGTRFAVASTSADMVEVCLVDGEPGALTERRVELREHTFGVWHGHVPGVRAGQRYGFRAHGPYRPFDGLRTNPRKILVDPYAERITGRVTDVVAARGWEGDPMSGRASTIDSLGSVPLSVVTAADPMPRPPRPDVPWSETVISELHVKGWTKLHPEVPEGHRGSYLGLAHPAVIAHLQRTGVTAVELLPVQAIAEEPPLLERGAVNYWGYSTLGFLAPHPGYAAVPGNECAEFRYLVDTLHAAGIEVILDIVPNHTCEGGVGGTTLSFRGLDAPAYYSLGGSGHDADITGTGNTLDAGSPTVIRLVCDAMRHWVHAYGVDGFRIDLASVLGRPRSGPFSPYSALLTAIAQDPALSTCKLIAEPWDATGEGYRVGGFGAAWSEWNGRYRDAVRDFWRGHGGVAELASRITGSSDIYGRSGRRPWASVNFVTAHDGFTLRDLVSYERKHNEGNGENNRDGTDDNRSQNLGVEGETDDAGIRAARLGTARAMLATLLLSIGTPMLTGGDERWRTQGGNNNPYCRDDETSWVDWTATDETAALETFTAKLAALRRESPVLHRDQFYVDGEVLWWDPSGRPMEPHDWHDDGRRTLVVLLADYWLLILHSGDRPVDCVLPAGHGGRSAAEPAGWGEPGGRSAAEPAGWGELGFDPVLDSTTDDGTPADPSPLTAGSTIVLSPRSVRLLRSR